MLIMNELRHTKDLVGKPVEVRVLFRALPLNHQGVTAVGNAAVYTISCAMEAPGDKMATTHAEPSNTVPHPPAPKRGKKGKPSR